MSEDGPQSSEDGSGLHSPIFGAQFTQLPGEICNYHQGQLDIRHDAAAGILASQFDYTNINFHPYLHLLETPLNVHYPHHHYVYHSEFSLPQRHNLDLDIPPHVYPDTCLPPPPAYGSVVDLDLSYQGSPRRRYFSEDLCSQSQPAASTSQDLPCRKISNQVIACRQCHARKIRCDSTRPACHNCVRRLNECHYDATPKRRGPDKRPGTRQHSCKKCPADGSSLPSLLSKRKRTSVRHDD
ncbi:uncharacterized protein HD556DRAFT_1495010 [Suillus plorans]|uniref:Zn(2)-C6 fungal-type domain-containing protein n=1 Tax=Suillus plorans TaxID=116603 RepID=A0A9P7AH21_9AGAM|nr:uncharacterized protein HD556DRAFT_1495010 [Suillus plorans]KAG1789314.1 hypothetical protein HD556DRAFT_1495010 [Suillus plorans]